MCAKYTEASWLAQTNPENKSQKGLPLETNNTQNHENLRLSLIESLHMQHCSLRGCIRPLAPA